MKVRITSCINPLRWYANQIGDVFEVETTPENGYYVVIEERGIPRLIATKDCEIIEDESTKDEKLFTAAVAAMQGMLGSERVLKMFGSDNEMPIKELIARDAFNYAEALIKEGKQRGHL